MNINAPRLLRTMLASLLAVGLAGCPGESEPEPRERVATPASNAVAARKWLEPADKIAPAQWLASREAGSDVAPGAPTVAAWQKRLDEADARFGETDRMIANRAAQLETMLGEIGVRESASQIIEEFMPFAQKGSRRGFSDLCQHYYNLRKQGLSQSAALAALSEEPVRAEPVAPADPPANPPSPAAPAAGTTP